MFRPVIQTLAAAVIIVSCSAANYAAEPAHLNAAIQLVRSVDPGHTDYTHHEPLVVWPHEQNGQPAQCQTDCSGFVNALLEHTYHIAPAELEQWLGRQRPRATEYFKAVSQQKHFRAIQNIREIAPGDILVIRYLPGDPENIDHNTGHIMLIASPAQPLGTSSYGVTWKINVIDESHSGHGPQDTRHQAGAKDRSGLGEGTLQLISNDAGNVTGYAWSTVRSSEIHLASKRPIVVGRLQLEK